MQKDHTWREDIGYLVVKVHTSFHNILKYQCYNNIKFRVCRDERDFGLETETETRVVSRPVSSFETTCQKSQYQSQNLRLISKVSVSVSNFETTMQKSQSQSQNAMDGLAHHRF